MRKTLSFIFILCILFSCSKENRWDCFKRSGKTIIEERFLNDFTELEVSSNFKIILIKDNINKATIKSGENLMPLIKTEINEGKLILKNTNRCNWSRSYSKQTTIELRVKNIKNILIKEICDISNTDTIAAENLKIEVSQNVVSFIDLTMHCNSFTFIQHSGTGTYNFKGIADSSYYYMKGTGYIFSNYLHQKTAYVVNKSTGDIHVNASKRVFVEYTGSGNVYYSGNPSEIIFDQSKSTGLIMKE